MLLLLTLWSEVGLTWAVLLAVEPQRAVVRLDHRAVVLPAVSARHDAPPRRGLAPLRVGDAERIRFDSRRPPARSRDRYRFRKRISVIVLHVKPGCSIKIGRCRYGGTPPNAHPVILSRCVSLRIDEGAMKAMFASGEGGAPIERLDAPQLMYERLALSLQVAQLLHSPFKFLRQILRRLGTCVLVIIPHLHDGRCTARTVHSARRRIARRRCSGSGMPNRDGFARWRAPCAIALHKSARGMGRP